MSMDATAMARTAWSFGWGTVVCVDQSLLMAVMVVTVVLIVGVGVGVDIIIIIMGSVIEVMVFGVKA